MVKLEQTGILSILSGRGRERVTTDVVQNIAATVVEASTESHRRTVTVPTISRTLDMLYFIVRDIIHRILKFYTYNIQAVLQLERHDPDTRRAVALPLENGD